MSHLIPPISGKDFDTEDLELIDCVAVAIYCPVDGFCIDCINMCQRSDNPCIVDIAYKVCGNGEFEFVPELTLFSVDTTDGKDGTWHELQSISTDSQHSGDIITVEGEFHGNFVTDMCDHISSFFSEPRVCFRLTLRRKEPTPGSEPTSIGFPSGGSSGGGGGSAPDGAEPGATSGTPFTYGGVVDEGQRQ